MSLIFYTDTELKGLGVQKGESVFIHRSVVFINPKNIKIGNNVRIDCFCLLSAGDEGIEINNNVHIAAGSMLFGGGGKITFENFSCISSRCAIYTASDDYIEGNMTNPTIPIHYRKLSKGNVYIGEHVVVGTGSTILENSYLNYGASVGAMSLIKGLVPQGAIYMGIPAKLYKYRDIAKLKKIEDEYYRDNKK